MSEQEKNCKITLYLDTPKMLLKKGTDPVYGDKATQKIPTWYSGHAFVGVTDENGKEQKWGFGPLSSMSENSLKSYFSGCEAYFKDEKDSHFTEAVIYPISQSQYQNALKKIEEIKANKGSYKVLSRNCSTVAASILKASGASAPIKLIAVSPHGLTLKKRALQVKRKTELALLKAKNKIKTSFGKNATPMSALLMSFIRKPLPVSIQEGLKASKDKAVLNSEAILKNLMLKRKVSGRT